MKKLIQRGASLLVVAGLVLSASGCASSTAEKLANQFKSGDNKNYVSGDGTNLEIAYANRGKSVDWTGVTEHGTVLSSANLTGVVTVLNFWYAAAPHAGRRQKTLRPSTRSTCPAGCSSLA